MTFSVVRQCTDHPNRRMLRICTKGFGNIERKVMKQKIVYVSPYEILMDLIDTFGRLHTNVSFFGTQVDLTVCAERLKNNESDFSTELFPFISSHESYSVPVPISASQVSILTGHSLQDVVPSNKASVLQNFELFDLDVYLVTAAFILFFVLLIFGYTLYHQRRELLRLEITRYLNTQRELETRARRRIKKITTRGFTCRFVKRQLARLFIGSNCRFKTVALLWSILTFCLINYFCILYSTSAIILKKPEMIESYKDLLEHETSSGILLDFLADVSHRFEHSGEMSVHRRIWNRYVQKASRFITLNKSPAAVEFLTMMNEIYLRMRKDRSVVIASSSVTGVIKSWICGLSPESDLRYLAIFTDPSEREELLGFPMSTHFSDRDMVIRGVKRYQQSGILGHFLEKLSRRHYDRLSKMAATSEQHVLQQRLACGGEYQVDTERLTVVTSHYWSSFFYAMIAIILLAFIVLTLEKVAASSTHH